MTNNDFYPIFIDQISTRFSKGSCIGLKAHIHAYLLPYCGEKQVGEITSEDINTIYDIMFDKGLAQNTVHGARSAFRTYFKIAIENGLTIDNPVRKARSVLPKMSI